MGEIDVGVGKGTVYNEYEFVGHGLRSSDSRKRMEEATEILNRIWTESPLTYEANSTMSTSPDSAKTGPATGTTAMAQRDLAGLLYRMCGKLGIPILTARLPVDRIRERWALYEAGLNEGGHDGATRQRLLDQSALWRNVYVAETDAQAEDELADLLRHTREHMMHVREAYNPEDFEIDPGMLNAWTDPAVPDSEAIPYVLDTGSLFGSVSRVKEQVAELRDVGVQHLLCQTGSAR